MGNNVGVVDYSIDWHLASEVRRKGGVAHTWFTIGVELVEPSEGRFDIEGGDSGNGSSETMASDIDGSSAVLVHDQLDLSLDGG